MIQCAPLHIRGLRKSFRQSGGRSHEALRGVDLDAQAGQVTTLLGTNGAGKSTTLACAQGLLKPDAGDISLLGSSPWRAPATLRARVGVMLQDGGLPPSAKPLAYLRHVAGLYAAPRPVGELASLLRLDELSRTPIRRLSGGQRQRVSLAAALVGDPELLFLDEPSAGLDPQSRQVVFELIAQLREEGRTIVLTTHLLEDAERLSDAVVVIERGRTVASGTVAELIGTDAAPELLVSFSPDAVLAWPDHLSPQRHGRHRYLVRGLDGPAALAALLDFWARRGLTPLSLRWERRSLEEAFLELASEAAEEPDAATQQEVSA